VAVVSAFIGEIASERGWSNYLRLIRSGSDCKATIVSADTGSNGGATYRFNIGGRSYHGTGPVCSARVGQQVEITYLAGDPSNSCLGSPVERLADEVVSFLFGGLSFPDQS